MNLVCRGLRGATTVEANTREAILEATRELMQKLVEANNVDRESVAAVFFTTTTDLNAEFPAVAARQLGWESVALLCGHEMQVPDGLPRCLRIMMLINTQKRPEELKNVYLKGAISLRNRGMS